MQISLVISDAAIRTASPSPVLLAFITRALKRRFAHGVDYSLIFIQYSIVFLWLQEINICQCVNN